MRAKNRSVSAFAPLAQQNLSKRFETILSKNSIETIEQLAAMRWSDVRNLDGFGYRGALEIEAVLKEHGLDFRPEASDGGASNLLKRRLETLDNRFRSALKELDSIRRKLDDLEAAK